MVGTAGNIYGIQTGGLALATVAVWPFMSF